MFGKTDHHEEPSAPPPPAGVSEIIFRVFDEKGRSRHNFVSRGDQDEDDSFQYLNDPDRAFYSHLISEALATRASTAVSFSYGKGRNKYLYVLPYERKWGKWRFACLQVTTARPDPDGGASQYVSALFENRVCLLLVDARDFVLAAGAKVPAPFGHAAEGLMGKNLSELFSPADLSMINSCSPDSNEAILSCVFYCLDGGRRDVEVKKYSAADGHSLFCVFDVTRPQFNEEITQISTRERRRIGQDLHDSIGQVLTGISLLSRSLANGLERDGSASSQDAAQISDLADDASNQIRQISRGLMPSDVVRRGLFASLLDLARVTTDSCGLLCEATLDESLEFPDGAVETHLFRIAQEAVNNAVRHSGASRIDILVEEDAGMPKLVNQDDGHWRNIMENAGGVGMKTMQYRASVINGRLNIQKNERGGTAVECRLEAEDLMETKVI